ncbi:MAG TPA: alpha/beta hydrolase [Stackebrandtia sp.]|uniref:alpha/beta fold hydrolase n=1 Tax=Stackebrandtia sp. TaxID=2023065 RepID=UPI002D71BA44|nr:alpha/beta hydrolase [Stackebrandtia sp.]HZE41619.1 alpha/beta hydrolase [Stackebrandtia sp.]
MITPEQLAPASAPMTMVLLHGAWHDGSAWTETRKHLEAWGHTVHTPTIPGHGPGADMSTTVRQMVDGVVQYIVGNNLTDIVLVGHSGAGIILTQAAPRLLDRLHRMVFIDAYILEDGNSVYDESPPEMQALIDALCDADGGFMIPFPVWRESMIQDASQDVANACYARLNREPKTIVHTKLDQKAFYRIVAEQAVRLTYAHLMSDFVIPIGEYNWWPRYPSRLPGARILRVPGSHELMFSEPRDMAGLIVRGARD